MPGLERFKLYCSRGLTPVPGRVGVPPAGLGVSPERTSVTAHAPDPARKAATQDASLGGQDAHPTRDAGPARKNGSTFIEPALAG